MPKAQNDGTYELDGVRYHIAAGDPLPDGATMVDEVHTATEPMPAEDPKATQPAEKKAVTGPSETPEAPAKGTKG